MTDRVIIHRPRPRDPRGPLHAHQEGMLGQPTLTSTPIFSVNITTSTSNFSTPLPLSPSLANYISSSLPRLSPSASTSSATARTRTASSASFSSSRVSTACRATTRPSASCHLPGGTSPPPPTPSSHKRIALSLFGWLLGMGMGIDGCAVCLQVEGGL